MFDSYLVLVVVSLLVVLALSAYSYRKAKGLEIFSVLALLGVMTFSSAPAEALEVRRDENMVNVASTETIDDTLVAASDTVIVDADINGDLVAVGRRVVVNGDVSGNLVTFASSISIEGSVGGLVVAGGDSIDLSSTSVGGDLWAAASSVNVDDESSIDHNAMIAAELISVAGIVGKDLYTAAETTELSGRVGENLEAYTHWLNLLGDARVEGDLRLHTDNTEALQLADSAVIGGEIEHLALPDDFERRNQYLTGEFYLHQVLRLASAFLAGMVLFWLMPVFRTAQIEGGVEGFATAGMGLVALISTPVICLLLAVTIVGLPVAITGFFLWIMLVYFAKIVIAPFVGRLILGGFGFRDSLPATLIAGLLVMIVAINIPAVGGVFNFLLTIIGVGVIVRLMLSYITALVDR